MQLSLLPEMGQSAQIFISETLCLLLFKCVATGCQTNVWQTLFIQRLWQNWLAWERALLYSYTYSGQSIYLSLTHFKKFRSNFSLVEIFFRIFVNVIEGHLFIISVYQGDELTIFGSINKYWYIAKDKYG